MSLGLPALICFGMYVGLALRGKAESGKAESGNEEPPTANHTKGDTESGKGERSTLNVQLSTSNEASTPHPQSLSPIEAEREVHQPSTINFFPPAAPPPWCCWSASSSTADCST
jgi:hypothetical protein